MKRRWYYFAGALGLGGAVAAIAAAASGAIPGGRYQGPGPNLPPGREGEGSATPPGAEPMPTYTPPLDLEPTDLWVSPECDAILVGPQWEDRTARPAIRAWLADGFVDKSQWHHHRVVREIVGPYSPLCVDTYPWLDAYTVDTLPPPDEYNAIRAQWEQDYPELAQLLGRVHYLYNEELEGHASGEELRS